LTDKARRIFSSNRPIQYELIFPGFPNDLKEVTGRIPVAKFERIEGDVGRQQTGAKMELMNFSTAITESHRFERGLFESFQSG
jgi:hypothetical protein